jgi:methyl-accepting chemotaxis protein
MRAPTSSPPTAWWGDRPVRTKVLASAGVAGLVAAGIGVSGLVALGDAASAAHELYDDNLQGVAAAADMDGLVGDLRVNIRDTILGADPAAAIGRIDDLAADFATATAAYRAETASEDTRAKLDEITAAMTTYVTLQKDVLVPLAQKQDYAGWIATNSSQSAPIVDKVSADIQQLRDLEGAEAQQAVAETQSAYRTQRTVAIALMIVGIGVSLGLGWFVAAGIARATRRVKDVVDGLAAGDLTRSSGLRTRDELGQMGQALDGAVDSLREVMSAVASSSDAVAAASEELSASSAQISASAEETSAQSGIVAAGAEEMGASIREISQNANEAARVAAQAVAEAETTNATVVKLGDSSREIGNVVKVITSIAEQTNLLALNATIEAARAGEAGKGFAVVANEVKELAQATARATEDITRRVEAIQGDTSGAVIAIGRISEIIGSINDYQLTIASAVEEQTATTNEMSRSVAEAADGSTGIATTIAGVSAAADSTTQALGQTRQAVDELSRMASDLRGSVARFTY